MSARRCVQNLNSSMLNMCQTSTHKQHCKWHLLQHPIQLGGGSSFIVRGALMVRTHGADALIAVTFSARKIGTVGIEGAAHPGGLGGKAVFPWFPTGYGPTGAQKPFVAGDCVNEACSTSRNCCHVSEIPNPSTLETWLGWSHCERLYPNLVHPVEQEERVKPCWCGGPGWMGEYLWLENSPSAGKVTPYSALV
jgi:hypothetical protein